MAHSLTSATFSTLSSNPRQAHTFFTHRRGFTIVELLIVVVVIAILATITVVAYNGIQARAVESSMQSTLRQAMSQIETDKVLTGHYASDAESVGEGGLASGGDTTLSYTLIDGGFCVSVAHTKSNTPLRYTTTEGKIVDGDCENIEEEEEDTLPPAIAAWAFNEGTGSTTASAIGSHNGTLGSGAGWATGRNGNGVSFNGTGSRVTVPNASPLNITGPMSIMAWVRPARVETQGVIKKTENGVTNGYELTLASTGRPFFRVNQTTSANTYRVDGPDALTLNSWTHLTGVYDGSTLRLYVNGTSTSPIVGPASINSNSLALTFGAEVSGAYPLEGRIDDVRIFNIALTPEQVTQYMALPVTP